MTPLTPLQRFAKRAQDLVLAGVGLAVASPLIFTAWAVARWETGEPGFFRQVRIGRGGRPFEILKIRTMRPVAGVETSATRADDPRMTRSGRLLRRTKIDELPELWNVLIGDMSLVGPRPDVPGFADELKGADRIILAVRPGITGPATLAFIDEEVLLAAQDDPDRYNAEVLYPAKVAINRRYLEQYSLVEDLRLLVRTLYRVIRRS